MPCGYIRQSGEAWGEVWFRDHLLSGLIVACSFISFFYRAVIAGAGVGVGVGVDDGVRGAFGRDSDVLLFPCISSFYGSLLHIRNVFGQPVGSPRKRERPTKLWSPIFRALRRISPVCYLSVNVAFPIPR